MVHVVCARKEEMATKSQEAPAEPVLTQKVAENSLADEMPVSKDDSEKDRQKNIQEKKEQIHPPTNPKSIPSLERMLEYEVSLNYQSADFLASRKKLLSISNQNAIILSSNSYRSNNQPYLNMKLMVKSSELYDVLLKIDTIGQLKSENIRAIDHTENNMVNKVKTDRAQIRLARRSKIQAPGSKDWQDRERLLSSSEDEIDHTKIEEWKLKDKITWAKLKLHLYGPQKPEKIEVPMYKNAFVGMVNLLLKLVYGIIYLLPILLVLAGSVYWYRKKRIKK